MNILQPVVKAKEQVIKLLVKLQEFAQERTMLRKFTI